jgi:peptidoglycan hydrolase CwlO-like protein
MESNDINRNDGYAEEESGRNRNNVWLILILFLLLCSVGFNIYQYFTLQQKEASLNSTIVSSTELKEQLQNDLAATRAQLEEYKGKVSGLDSVISKRERELVAKASEIEKLLKQNKMTYNKYLSAKSKIDELTYYSNKYLKEIDQLSKDKKELTEQNQNLQAEVKEKKKTIDNLTDENVTMGNRLELARRLTADNLVITGVRFKKGNKEHETSNGDKIEKLKVCFTVPSNHAAPAGKRDVYMQVVDPKGQTIAIASMGAGTITVDGEQAQYSIKEEIDYQNDASNYCLYWTKGDTKLQE